MAVSNVFKPGEGTLLIHFAPPIFAQPVTLLLLMWVMDDDGGEGDVGDDGWWMIMSVIMVGMVTFLSMRISTQYPNTLPAPIHLYSHGAQCRPYR